MTTRHFITESELKPFAETINLEKEDNVRKLWLVSFLAYSIVTVFNTYSALEDLQTTLDVSSLIIMAITRIIPWFLITFYCSYKKRGTGWLLWILISLPIREFIPLLIALKLSPAWDTFTMVLIGLIFWNNSIRLLKTNSTREYTKVLAFKNKYGPDANGFCC